MKQDYNSLESQIGDIGAEETEGLIGKKLKHSESYGKKSNLSEEEQESLNKFIRKGESMKNAQDDVLDNNLSSGWVVVDREEMGERSLFYPEGWEFFIRPATVSAIKNWTSIDEERPDQVNKVFNDIIKTCLKINTHSEQGASVSNINSWDRFWFILKIREITFSKGESKIEFEDSCPECEEDITYTLNSSSLFYDFPDGDIIDRYWTGDKWIIDPTEYGLNHPPITLYTPTIGKDEVIIDWASNRARNNQKIDETFIKFLVWMLEKPIRDNQLLDKRIQKLYSEYKSWDIETFSFIDDVINNITINPSEKLKCTCPHCSMEATSNVQFPNGVRALFKVETKVRKFGSR